MKIDRLLGIVTTLLQKGKVTAPYLAEKFEVSRRTIFRDLDAICMAGIPIVTTQGGGGGISIAAGSRSARIRARLRASPPSTIAMEITNISVPTTLTCIGTPRCATPQT